MMAPTVRFQIDVTESSHLGPDRIALLEAIRDSGSLSQAARNRAISYRHAWMLIDALNRAFREPVTVTITGGKGGRSVFVTAFGEMLIRNYRELEQEIDALAHHRLDAILPFVVRHAAPEAASPRGRIAYETGAIDQCGHSA
jgi:molybdate transport system regulatory protein